MKISSKLIIFGIILFAAAFRFYNVNWDQGYHLHPDERAIIMTVDKLEFPTSINQFFSPTSPWNPHFFAYGSLPFYLLKIAGEGMSVFDPLLSQYGMINIVGRYLSAFCDLITIVFIFKIGRKLFSTFVGYLAAFFYAVSVLPIQLSHFYAVDTMLTCFIVITLYQLIRFYEKPTITRALLVGLFFGLALATKVSAIVLVVSIGACLAADFIFIFLKNPHKPKHWSPYLPAFLRHLLLYALVIGVTTIATFIFFEPYAVIDFQNFLLQTQQQSQMTKDAFTFPYTLQYVGKTPYLYELKNIFLFGMGPLLALIAFAGTIYMILLAAKKEHFAKASILLVFFFTYFIIVGNFAIGFMRYMLPIYPLLALFAAVITAKFFEYVELHGRMKIIVTFYLAAVVSLWAISFLHIYTKINPRIEATDWINAHIPAGKSIAVEHWDDPLPLSGHEKYFMLSLPLYDPDTQAKWDGISQQLQQADYIVVASNRLATPLQKLTNCSQLPQHRCYTQSAQYYQKLFADELGFQKVAEFTNYPIFPLIKTPINDQAADESFTVYDHPKIMIFQKTAVPPSL